MHTLTPTERPMHGAVCSLYSRVVWITKTLPKDVCFTAYRHLLWEMWFSTFVQIPAAPCSSLADTAPWLSHMQEKAVSHPNLPLPLRIFLHFYSFQPNSCFLSNHSANPWLLFSLAFGHLLQRDQFDQ